TSDGGYVGAGTLETFDTLGTGANLGYTAWVFKIDSNGCLRDPCVNSISLPEEESGEMLLSIYPNPSSQYFTIKWLGAKDGQAQLLDVQGRVLESIALKQGVGVLNPTEHLPNGLYLIRVSTRKGEVRTQKVVLQR
ncbi:MAG: T9SS type A sorting domain-containing protein, partial [Bacteroidetes bacterium]|nr:T9SS type A sorting domain-containing protein [Bacteroidota bacterium]